MTPRENVRLSHLAEMLIGHLIYGRTRKALLIAQYLRRHFGMVLDMSLCLADGYHRSHRLTQ